MTRGHSWHSPRNVIVTHPRSSHAFAPLCRYLRCRVVVPEVLQPEGGAFISHHLPLSIPFLLARGRARTGLFFVQTRPATCPFSASARFVALGISRVTKIRRRIRPTRARTPSGARREPRIGSMHSEIPTRRARCGWSLTGVLFLASLIRV